MRVQLRHHASQFAFNHVHPCTVDGKPHLVYQPELEQHHALFKQLVGFAKSSGQKLLRDRRKASSGSTTNQNRRKQWIPIIVLGASGLLPVTTAAKNTLESLATDPALAEFIRPADPQAMSALAVEEIETLLTRHFVPGPNDPDSIRVQIRAIAEYYSLYPRVHVLLRQLEKHAWQLHFSPKIFKTELFGSSKHIGLAKIHFDLGLAAQLQFDPQCKTVPSACIASPADLLLHELLHVFSVYANPEKFLMGTRTRDKHYPHQHESETIQLEQFLFRSMSAIDQLTRPYRTQHIGKSISVACATCRQ